MMTTGGWVFLSLFWGFVIIVTGSCFKLVLFEKTGGAEPAGDAEQRSKPWAPPDADGEGGS